MRIEKDEAYFTKKFEELSAPTSMPRQAVYAVTEEYEEHWNKDMKAARGIFGWPLLVSVIFLGLLVGLFL